MIGSEYLSFSRFRESLMVEIRRGGDWEWIREGELKGNNLPSMRDGGDSPLPKVIMY